MASACLARSSSGGVLGSASERPRRPPSALPRAPLLLARNDGRVAVAVSVGAGVGQGAGCLSAGIAGLDVAATVRAASGVDVPWGPAQATSAVATRPRMIADGPLMGRPLVAAGSGFLRRSPSALTATRGHGEAVPTASVSAEEGDRRKGNYSAPRPRLKEPRRPQRGVIARGKVTRWPS